MTAALLAASIELRDDMLMRAKMNARLRTGDVVVDCGHGVWVRFNKAINAAKGKKK